MCEQKKTPHKHAALIKAWADRPETRFQFRGAGCQSNCWYTMVTPDWSHSEIRIKPEPKPDVVKYSTMTNGGTVNTFFSPNCNHNIKSTFDGETGELKSVVMFQYTGNC